MIVAADTHIPWFFSHFFPWPFILVGSGMVYDAIRALITAHGSHRWPTVEGKVVRSTVKVKESEDEVSYLTYIPLIEYRYSSKGEVKTSSKIGLADRNAGSQTKADAIAKRYAVGRSVCVYCSPHDSTIAVLEPGVRWSMFGTLIGGLFFGIAGALMLWIFGGLSWLLR
jgi:Protein of unknown function (DUF3592)